MEKNTGALVLSILGAIFGLIGGIVWATCADAMNTVSGGATTGYLVCFIIFGIGGAIIALVGGIRAFGFKSGAFIVTLVGFLFEVGMLIATCVAIEGFSFLLNFSTIVSIVLLLIATVFARKKN